MKTFKNIHVYTHTQKKKKKKKKTPNKLYGHCQKITDTISSRIFIIMLNTYKHIAEFHSIASAHQDLPYNTKVFRLPLDPDSKTWRQPGFPLETGCLYGSYAGAACLLSIFDIFCPLQCERLNHSISWNPWNNLLKVNHCVCVLSLTAWCIESKCRKFACCSEIPNLGIYRSVTFYLLLVQIQTLRHFSGVHYVILNINKAFLIFNRPKVSHN